MKKNEISRQNVFFSEIKLSIYHFYCDRQSFQKCKQKGAGDPAFLLNRLFAEMFLNQNT